MVKPESQNLKLSGEAMAAFVASIRTAKHAPASARKLISLNPDPGSLRFTAQVAVTDNSSAATPYSPVSAESKKQMIQTAAAARAGDRKSTRLNSSH